MAVPTFVGRDRELAALQGFLDKALAGAGQVCFVAGQAGSGKTALIRHFVTQTLAANPDVVVALGTCNAQTGVGDPYLPFREALTMLTDEGAAHQAAGTLSAANASRLRGVLVRSVQVLVEVAPELVGAFVPGAKLLGTFGKAIADKVGWMDRLDGLVKQKALAEGTAEAVADQSRIFEQYTAFMQTLSQEIPLILVLDDLQWADGASLGLLFHLGRHIEASRILILGAYRPDDVALGRDGGRHPLEPVINEFTRYFGDVVVDLDAISEEASRRFVADLLDAQPNCLGDEFRQALYERTEGHALFTVELLQTMMERGDLVRDADGCWVEGPALNWGALPARVEGVVEERIGRLPPDLAEMIQVASVEGEAFSAEVVAQVQNVDLREAIRQFSRDLQRRYRLVTGEGVVRVGHVRLSRYRFTHNLFYHYLYDSLAEAERVYLHGSVGQVLEALFAGQTEEVAAQLARHFEQAGVPSRAARYRLQAGEGARRLSALHEAEAHLTRGLALAAKLGAGPDRLQLELELQVALGMVLLAKYGYASPQADRAFAQARALSRALGDPPQVIKVLLAQAVFHLMRGHMEAAREEANHVLRLAEQADDSGLRLTAHLLLGVVALYRADYGEARQNLEEVVDLYDPEEHRELAFQQGQDPGVRALSFLARVLWLQGYPEQALARQEAALALAQQLDHPYSCTVAALHAATLHSMLRQWPLCQVQAEQALALARQGGFAMWQANAAILHGLALSHQGRAEEGILELTQGLYRWEATGAGLVALGRSSLADVYLVAGRRAEGLRAVDEALYPGDEVWWQPEAYRLRAELLCLDPAEAAEAEALLCQAADLAAGQGARSLKLRILTSLGRLLQRQGRGTEVRERLADCYETFGEGLDLPDLRAARELLAALE